MKSPLKDRYAIVVLVVSIFLFLFSFAVQSFAEEPCGQRRTALSDFADFGCDLQVMKSECKNWFYENPETLAYAKDCKKDSRSSFDFAKIASTCGETLGEKWSEIWVQVGKAGAALDACEKDFSCKYRLAEEAYFVCDGIYPCTDEKKLKEVSVGDLLRKRENVRAMATNDLKYRESLKSRNVPLPDPRETFKDFQTMATWAAIKDHFKKLGVKAECYNAEGYAKMVCAAAATIVDPVTAAGGAALGVLRGSKWVAEVLKTKALVRASVAEVPVLGIYDAQSYLKPGAFPEGLRLSEAKNNSFFTPDPSSKNEIVTASLGEKRNYVAHFQYEIKKTNPSRMEIVSVDVEEDLRRKGVSEALFAKALNAHPEVTEVETILIKTNKEALRDALAAGKSCADAMLETPAAKMRVRFGFTKLILASCGEDGGPYKLIQGR